MGKWRVYSRLRRGWLWVHLRATMTWLWARNRLSSSPALGTAPVLVSLTSHGQRIERAWYTLESIARGRVRPARIIMWLDASLDGKPLQAAFTRLRNRGVEFHFVEDIGPHQKYFYAIDEALADGLSLATADDDCLYGAWWLEQLLSARLRTPGTILCYRARRFCLDADGQPAPYKDWPLMMGDVAAADVFFTGVSGVLYPPAFLLQLGLFGTAFLQCCPKADDIWLNYVAITTGTPARQVHLKPRKFPTVPDTQGIALWPQNAAGGNDAQIRATYDTRALARLSGRPMP